MQKKNPFSPSLCLARILLQSPQPLLLPRGPRPGNARGTMAALQTGIARPRAAAQTHGAEPHAWSLAAGQLGHPPQARDHHPPPGTAPVASDNSPQRLWRRLCPELHPEPERQHKVKQRTTSALSSHCLPSSKIRVVEY